MLWPAQIRLVSLPSVVFLTLFWSMGLLTLAMAWRLKIRSKKRGSFLWIGCTALAMGLYSFATALLYSASSFEAVAVWQRLQLISTILVFVFFVCFSANYLLLESSYWYRWLPLATLAFLPLIAVRHYSLGERLSPKIFPWFSYSTRIFEYELGPVTAVLFLWFFLNVLLMSGCWLRFYRRHPEQWTIPLSFVIFFAASVNDGLIALGVYHFYYLLELSFLGFVFSMGYQVVWEYISAARALLFKSQQVEGLNEEMQFLISSISHDLKGPLLSIHGFLDGFESRKMGEPESRDAVERIRRNAVEMEGMLDSLLQFMRVGRVELTRGPVDLIKLCEELSWTLEGEGLPARTRLTLPEPCEKIISCERSIRQILSNLLHNAFKYGKAAENGVSVECETRERGILICVADRGPGIPEGLRQKIFDPFFRLESHTPGTGMGLAIAKRLAEHLGGRMGLDPEYKNGARFCLYLPKVK